ncbi:MAG: hypothetical protein A2854_04170 [Parcubacteria group bacterium RIFCSPHIGHO2_01_FULL_56_18]|nr:MAG: hypothetical protein A2854_04170 [Parcubacteria group bacterium RIFCSPHIGHO2_01_FULL_56_18]
MRNTVGTLILLLILAGGYIFLRYRDADKFQIDYVNLQKRAHTNISEVNNRFPVICWLRSSGFDGYAEGRIYAVQGKILNELRLEERNGVFADPFLIDLQQKKVYKWSNETKQGYVVGLDELVELERKGMEVDSFSSLRRGDCSPWWFPDHSLFTVPSDVNFVPLSSRR